MSAYLSGLSESAATAEFSMSVMVHCRYNWISNKGELSEMEMRCFVV